MAVSHGLSLALLHVARSSRHDCSWGDRTAFESAHPGRPCSFRSSRRPYCHQSAKAALPVRSSEKKGMDFAKSLRQARTPARRARAAERARRGGGCVALWGGGWLTQHGILTLNVTRHRNKNRAASGPDCVRAREQRASRMRPHMVYVSKFHEEAFSSTALCAGSSASIFCVAPFLAGGITHHAPQLRAPQPRACIAASGWRGGLRLHFPP